MSFNNHYKLLQKSNPISQILTNSKEQIQRPFKLNWLNSAHLETLLPNSPWEQVYQSIIEEFCNKIESQFDNEKYKQAFFEILGNNFVSKYFPHDKIDVSLVKPPFISSEESIVLFVEAEKLLNETLNNILKEKEMYNKDNSMMSSELVEYSNGASKIFENHFKKNLAKREAEYYKSISTMKPNFHTESSPLHHKPTTAVSSVYDHDLPYTVMDIYPYGPEMLLAPPPTCISVQTEFTGESLASLALNNFNEINKISKAMIGRRLPISLKKLIWKRVLYGSDETILNSELINYDEITKEKFTRTVARGLAELKIINGIKTPVNELLENLIIEIYEKSPPLRKLSKDVDFMSEAVRMLNILYAYDRSYEPYLVFWLFPLHYGLKSTADDLPVNKIEFSYEVASCLSLLKRDIYPQWTEIFSISQTVMDRLLQDDPELINHLVEIAKVGVISQPKDFLVQIIESERNQVNSKRSNSDLKMKNPRDYDIINFPVIFIRKWIGEAFVSVIRNEAVIFVFDQLFMTNFNVSVFEAVCLSLIMLLRPIFMSCRTHNEMKYVFLESPAELLTVDIMKSWVWIYNGHPMGSVVEFNRKLLEKPITKTPTPVMPDFVLTPVLTPPIAFNNLHIKLILSKSSTDDDFIINKDNLLITASLVFVNSEIKSVSTVSIPVLKDTSITEENVKKILTIPKDWLELKEENITTMRDKFSDIEKLSLLLIVEQKGDVNLNLPNSIIGWCMVDCFSENKDLKPKIKKQSVSESQVHQEQKQFDEFKSYIERLHVTKFQKEIPLNFNNPEINFIQREFTDVVKNSQLLEGSSIELCGFNPLEYVATPISTPLEQPIVETPEPDNKLSGEVGVTKDKESWVPYNPEAYEAIRPRLSSRIEPFCIYVDQIRFLPDNVTIIKVTGRLLQTDHDSEIPDLLLVPDVESDPRNPMFRQSSRVIVNMDRKLLLSRSSFLLLRVYTVLRKTLELVVVGNCLVPLFDPEQDILQCGCYQKRLRNQLPKSGMIDASNLSENSFNSAPCVEGVSVTYRIWPYTESPIPPPTYSSGVYQSAECEPTDFEWDLFKLYKRDELFPTDYRDVVREIKFRDADPILQDVAVSHSFMMEYIPRRLDVTKYLPENEAPKHISRELMFHYRLDKGLYFKIDRVYGLESEQLKFVTTKVLRGSSTAIESPRPTKGYGLDKFYVTTKFDLNSPINATRWTDEYMKIHPYFDEKALLVIQVWGISANLKENEFYNRETNQKITKLTKENLLGWSALELFSNGFVTSGKHQLPIYQNRLHLALLKRFQNQSIKTILQKEAEFEDLDSDSIVIQILDGHKNVEDYKDKLPNYSDIIDALPTKKAAYLAAMKTTKTSKTVLQEIKATTTTESQNPTKFLQTFDEFANKIVISSTGKMPYLPIFV